MNAFDIAVTESALPKNVTILDNDRRKPGNSRLNAKWFEIALKQREREILRARSALEEDGRCSNREKWAS